MKFLSNIIKKYRKPRIGDLVEVNYSLENSLETFTMIGIVKEVEKTKCCRVFFFDGNEEHVCHQKILRIL